MKIRLHLVRFMYINLLLSCCFWLYDNAVAADATTTTIKNANGEADSPADPRTHLPVSSLASGEGEVNEEKVARSLRTNFIKLTTRQNADNIVMKKLGNEPRTTSAKITKPPAAIDTSVNLNALPPSVNNNNINNDNEFISLVHHSEFDNNNNADNDEATAQVPKNQLENEVNSNVNNINQNTNANPDANEQLQQPKHVGHSTTTSPNQEQQHQHNEEESLPKIIPELPAVMVTAELPVEAEHIKDRLEAIIMPNAPSQDSSNQSENQEPSQAIEGAEKVPQNAELKINDPGGGLELGSELNAEVDINVTGDTRSLESNATVEEVPMPVFSEWAQKQMEAEASREQAMELEQQVVNSSAQRRNATGSGSGKPSPLKSRAKNYASPDCGAKIIASNGDATNTGAVLSHSSDEYMLSTCGSRIWFVVELCEAVQAQKVDLANFELFSSSPKNFTVAVSKRFPTRDWSNVGRFTAEDKRTVQTFELHPHLFGKFVRVDIHSHYSKEHFCPISLFRVFGTSEFEAFETEIRHSDELDDFDDDFAGQEQPHKTLQGNGNIFQSASDAVMQMVKKAAQVLVKPTKLLRSPESLHCYTPTAGLYSCQGCNSSIVERINNLLSCQPEQLQLLLLLPQLRAHLQHTRICQAEYNISFGSARMEQREACSGMDKRQSFYLSMLPSEHVGAMCKLLQAEYNTITVGQPVVLPQASGQQKQHFNVPEQLNENVTTADPTKESIPNGSLPAATPSLQIVPAEISSADNPPNTEIRQDPLATIGEPPSDVNIFNVPKDNQKDASTTSGTTASNVPEAPKPIPTPPLADKEVEVASTQDNTMPISQQAPTAATTLESESGDLIGSGNGLDDANLANWESIDSLLTTTVASITAGGGAAAAAAAVVNGNVQIAGTASVGAASGGAATAGGINMQPKLTNGAQSESVFIRLSNRIKALERNMSLSGQYLEELSRRYKKQVEELQQTLTQQTLTVRTLEEQSRRYIEQEQLYQQQSAELAGDVRALTYQVQACILVIIIVGTCIFLMLVMGTVYYRKLRHQNQQLQPPIASPTSSNLTKQKLSRRKSYEQMMQQSPGKQRRPSEEAMLILNSCGDVTEIANGGRQRKISVCYGSNNNIAGNMFNTKTSLHRRKGAKQSWHTSLDSAQVACAEHLDKFFDVDTLKNNKLAPKAGKKKSQQLHQLELKRQESAPGNYTQNSLPEEEPTQSDFDESLILDDDDLCNFIPNSDLAYNEFMPEGPSGYQIVDTVDGKSDKSTKKFRRVSSPAFFKSPFSKSKNKGGHFNGLGGVKGSQSAHEATSWEWYRLRRSEKNSKQLSVPSVSVTPNASLDSSSISEINFPLNSTQNSFRILGEAIMSAGVNKDTGKGSNVAAGSSSSSGASTTSSTTKKKQRAFNNIFRKVF